MNPPRDLAPVGSAVLAAEFQLAVAQIPGQPWFTAANWTIQAIGGENWTGFQLSKTNWFNQAGRGIHFETWLSDDVIQSGVLRFQTHVMHAGMTFPGTDKKAASLSRPMVARHRELIESLGFRPLTAAGMTLLDARAPLDETNLTEVILDRCQPFSELGAAIDDILACILEGRKIPPAPRKAKPASAPGSFGANILPGWDSATSPWFGRSQPKVGIALHPEADGTLRVEITGKAATNHDAIVGCAGIPFTAGRKYQARYEVKAATARWMTGNIREAEPPRLEIGVFKGRTLTPEWQTVEWEFTATRDTENGEVIFAVGKVPNVVWLRGVEIRAEVK